MYGERVSTPRKRRVPVRLILLAVGLAAIITGVTLIAVPLLGVFQRGQADQSALNAWNSGGKDSIAGAPSSSGSPEPTTVSCGSSSPSDFALVTFNAPASEHYAAVATDGTWDALHNRSMVHYTGTPDPGGLGNSIIAFHREPDFEHIDELNVGDTVSIEDRSCKTWTYKVTARWVLDPSKVTQLGPTTGHDLTLITCTPFWVDSQRMVWRASLVTPTT